MNKNKKQMNYNNNYNSNKNNQINKIKTINNKFNN